MSDPTRDSAGVAVPPPLLYVGGFLVGYALHRVAPVTLVSWPAAAGPIGWGFVAVGALLTGSSLVTFRRAGQTPNPMKPITAVVVHGPYRFTRNPMYLGWVVMYLGAVLLAQLLWPLVVLVVVQVVMRGAVIAREERYLEAKFGEQYRAYKARVRRWL